MSIFSLLRKTGKLFAARKSAGSLFDMVSTAMLKVQLQYSVNILGTWSRGHVEE